MSFHAFVRPFGQLVMLASVLAATAPQPAAAQTTTGTIRGSVKSASGGALADAEVQAKNVATGVVRTASANADGSYILVGLGPAFYDVSARRIGSAPQTRRVEVLIGATLSLDFTLTAGAVQLQEVVVQAASPAVEMRTSEVATNVTPQQIQRLPTSSRNFLDLAALAPGVIVSEDRINPSLSQGVASRNFSAGAQGANDVNVFVDGASLKNDLTAGGIAGQDASRGNPFPRNAIQEYRVLTQNFKAEYQKSSSAIVTASTRSGGSVWSGDVLFGYQNKDLLSLDTFQLVTKHTADSIARVKSIPSTFQKPDYTRSLLGLSVGGPLIQNRLFFFGSYEGNYQNRNNQVTITKPTGFAALDTVPFAQYAGSFVSPFRETLLFGKLNYAMSEHSSAELSLNLRHETDVRDFGVTTSFQSAVNYRNTTALGILKYNIFSGPWLNETMVTYERFRRNPSPNTPGVSSRQYFAPPTCCTEFARLGSNLSTQDFTQRRIGVRNDVTYTGWHAGGDHVMKAGVDAEFLHYNVEKRNDETPRFVYADSVNCNPNCTGNEGFLYRAPYQLVYGTGNPFLTANNLQLGTYLQDDWSPTNRLTLNLGIRWDFESHMFNYDYVTPKIVRDTILAYNNTLQRPIDPAQFFTDGTQRKKFYGAFQPRLGFSYALDAENKTALFGGVGIFYDRSYFDISVDETLKLTHATYTVHFANPGTPPAAGQIAWDNRYLTASRATLDSLVASSSAGKEIWLISNHAKVPRSTQWNLGIRRLFGDVLVSTAYVGVRGYNGLVFNWANLNFKPDTSCCVGGDLGHGFTNVLYTTNDVRTWYDALQVQINRPYRRTGNTGWGAGLAYTVSSRSLQGIDAVGDQFAFPRDSLIHKHPINDEKSRLVANWTVDVPYAAGVQFSGLVTLGTGARLDVGGRFDYKNYHPGAFTPTQYGFVFPGGWAYRSVDLRLRKDFPDISGTTLAVTADLFNALNFQNLGCYNTTAGTAGCVVSDPRRLQIGGEYSF